MRPGAETDRAAAHGPGAVDRLIRRTGRAIRRTGRVIRRTGCVIRRTG
jgi:hypothetical protein